MKFEIQYDNGKTEIVSGSRNADNVVTLQKDGADVYSYRERSKSGKEAVENTVHHYAMTKGAKENGAVNPSLIIRTK